MSKRAQIIGLLVEGNSLRATARLADVTLNTVTRLLISAGTECAIFQDKKLRNIKSRRVQVDTIERQDRRATDAELLSEPRNRDPVARPATESLRSGAHLCRGGPQRRP